MIDISNFAFSKLTKDSLVHTFNCNDDDLNSFIIDDAQNYANELLAVTYTLTEKHSKKIAAYFSLLNDKVAYDQNNKGFWNRINRKIHNNKRRKNYPSVKIGRLAVASEYENQGLGSLIINFIKSYMIKDNKTGCRFLTVDAYAKATDFYKKNDFEYITSLDVLDTTRLMYFDLKNIIK